MTGACLATAFLAAAATFLTGAAAFLAGAAAFLAVAFFAGVVAFFATAFLAGAAATFFARACCAGAFSVAEADFLRAGAFLSGALFSGAPDGSASSATRRGGSRPASTNGRTWPFLRTWRALVGGGVPMAVKGM